MSVKVSSPFKCAHTYYFFTMLMIWFPLPGIRVNKINKTQFPEILVHLIALSQRRRRRRCRRRRTFFIPLRLTFITPSTSGRRRSLLLLVHQVNINYFAFPKTCNYCRMSRVLKKGWGGGSAAAEEEEIECCFLLRRLWITVYLRRIVPRGWFSAKVRFYVPSKN